MKPRDVLLLCSLTAAAVPAAHSAETSGELNWYNKTFFMVSVPPESTGGQTSATAINRLRLQYARNTGWGVFSAAYSVSPCVQDQSLYTGGVTHFLIETAPPAYRVTDIASPVYGPDGTVAVYQNLDRLFDTYSTGQADISIGRQAVAWGSAKTVNPTDVLAPYRFEELDTEERRGIDAVRLRVADGDFGEWDAGWVAGSGLHIDESAFYIRKKINNRSTDLSVLLMDFRQNLMAGLDMARSIGGAGAWLEAGYVFAKYFGDYKNEKGNNYLRLSIGSDYHLAEDLYGYIEYHFNGAGADSPESYTSNLSTPAYIDGTVFLLGRNYLTPGITCQVTPLLTLSAQIIASCTDGSCYLNPSLEYNIGQNSYLRLGAFNGFGKEPHAGSGSATNTLRSEFGSYPDTYYSSFRIYF